MKKGRCATSAFHKIRPIDDSTESLANLTNCGNETIAPHGIDVVISSFGLRIRLERKMGRQPAMVARTIDLRKAYKQSPLSEAALRDSYLCMYNPESGEPGVPIQSPALRCETAVHGFCRVSHAIWWLGVRLLSLQWSVFFDDFVLGCMAHEGKHIDLIESGFFATFGWESSGEKDQGFSAIARALGVEISLADASSGLIRVQKTESRRRALQDSINAVLTTKGAMSREFETLRGRLLFAENQVFGIGEQSFP